MFKCVSNFATLSERMSLCVSSPASCCRTFGRLRARWWFWRVGSVGALRCRSGGTDRGRRSWTLLTFVYSRKVRRSPHVIYLYIIMFGPKFITKTCFSPFGNLASFDESEPRSAAESGMSEFPLFRASSFRNQIINHLCRIVTLLLSAGFLLLS